MAGLKGRSRPGHRAYASPYREGMGPRFGPGDPLNSGSREARPMLKKIMEFLTLKWLWDRHEGKR